ncbi:MAG: hypothetical protein FJ161_03145 [Gammaproteobacteria bacterium]|nr:hypothetical protein [Gammaproteobacteria bacterium]
MLQIFDALPFDEQKKIPLSDRFDLERALLSHSFISNVFSSKYSSFLNLLNETFHSDLEYLLHSENLTTQEIQLKEKIIRFGLKKTSSDREQHVQSLPDYTKISKKRMDMFVVEHPFSLEHVDQLIFLKECFVKKNGEPTEICCQLISELCLYRDSVKVKSDSESFKRLQYRTARSKSTYSFEDFYYSTLQDKDYQKCRNAQEKVDWIYKKLNSHQHSFNAEEFINLKNITHHEVPLSEKEAYKICSELGIAIFRDVGDKSQQLTKIIKAIAFFIDIPIEVMNTIFTPYFHNPNPFFEILRNNIINQQVMKDRTVLDFFVYCFQALRAYIGSSLILAWKYKPVEIRSQLELQFMYKYNNQPIDKTLIIPLVQYDDHFIHVLRSVDHYTKIFLIKNVYENLSSCKAAPDTAVSKFYNQVVQYLKEWVWEQVLEKHNLDLLCTMAYQFRPELHEALHDRYIQYVLVYGHEEKYLKHLEIIWHCSSVNWSLSQLLEFLSKIATSPVVKASWKAYYSEDDKINLNALAIGWYGYWGYEDKKAFIKMCIESEDLFQDVFVEQYGSFEMLKDLIRFDENDLSTVQYNIKIIQYAYLFESDVAAFQDMAFELITYTTQQKDLDKSILYWNSIIFRYDQCRSILRWIYNLLGDNPCPETVQPLLLKNGHMNYHELAQQFFEKWELTSQVKFLEDCINLRYFDLLEKYATQESVSQMYENMIAAIHGQGLSKLFRHLSRFLSANRMLQSVNVLAKANQHEYVAKLIKYCPPEWMGDEHQEDWMTFVHTYTQYEEDFLSYEPDLTEDDRAESPLEPIRRRYSSSGSFDDSNRLTSPLIFSTSPRSPQERRYFSDHKI